VLELKLSANRARFPPNQLSVDLGSPAGKQPSDCRWKKFSVFARINIEENLATRFELVCEQIVEEKNPFVRSPRNDFVWTSMEGSGKSGYQIKLSVEVGQRLKRLDSPNSSFHAKEIEKLVANLVPANVESHAGVAELFGDEQKESGATAEVENLLGIGPIKFQSPNPRQIAFQPSLGVSVLGIMAGRRSVALLNIAQTFPVDSL